MARVVPRNLLFLGDFLGGLGGLPWVPLLEFFLEQRLQGFLCLEGDSEGEFAFLFVIVSDFS